MTPLKILVVGQTPPPVHGQAVMTKFLLEGEYTRIQLHYVRMAFSENIDEVGSFKWGKLLHLAAVILRIWWMRITSGAKILYYPPAGPKKNAFYRDAAVLILTRWLFRKTVFHFYAAGISDLYPELSPFLRKLYRLAYFKADLGIALFEDGLRDPAFLECGTKAVVPCGIPDEYTPPPKPRNRSNPTHTITFLAMLSESKGVFLFLDACAALIERGMTLQPVLVGWAESKEFEAKLKEKISELKLDGILERHGKTVGPEKHEIYHRTSVFCFPTFYPSEGSPVVLLEAMQFGLPIVASSWRGCVDTVDDGVTGYLVPPKDTQAVAEKLYTLLSDQALLESMSHAARTRYENLFTISAFCINMEDVLSRLR